MLPFFELSFGWLVCYMDDPSDVISVRRQVYSVVMLLKNPTFNVFQRAPNAVLSPHNSNFSLYLRSSSPTRPKANNRVPGRNPRIDLTEQQEPIFS